MAGPGGGGRGWFVQVNAEGAEARRAKTVKTEQKGGRGTGDPEKAACQPVGQTRVCMGWQAKGFGSLRSFSEVEAKLLWGPSVNSQLPSAQDNGAPETRLPRVRSRDRPL